VIWASYQEEVKSTCEGIANTIYVPDSSWTVGRNTLYAKALALQQEQGWRAEYFVFTDDDVELHTAAKGWDPYDLFHAALGNVQPAVASVSFLDATKKYGKGHHHKPERNVCGPITPCAPDVDAAVNAFHATAAPILLPYVTYFDDRDWWSSQGALIELMVACMQDHAVQFNQLYIMNPVHRPYPRGGRVSPSIKPLSGGLSEVAQYLQPRVSECMRDQIGLSFIGKGKCQACEKTCACTHSLDCKPAPDLCPAQTNASEPFYIDYADVVKCKPNLKMA
jgi:hypothetical protein